MIYVVLFLATSLIFLVADAIMLRSVIQPVFARHLGDTLYAGGFRLLPAILFYFTYMGGILYFASLPRTPGRRAGAGAAERGDPGPRGLWHV